MGTWLNRKKSKPIKLQLYGHPLGVPSDAPTTKQIVELHEVSICSNAKGLRKLAKHLLKVADSMDQMDDENAHWHFQPETRPEIVIVPYSTARNEDSKIVYVPIDSREGTYDRVPLAIPDPK